MKRVMVFSFLILVAFLATVSPLFTAQAAEPAVSYALITSENAPFLREPNEPSISNTYFTLPKTYFVLMVTTNYTASFHKVRYRDLDGYVRKSDVEIKNYTPVSVFPSEVTLKVNIDAETVNLRARPDHLSSDVVYRLPANTARIEYYGSATGTDSLMSGNTAWYYVKLTPGSDSVVRGYLYAPYILLESVIPPDNDTSAVIAPTQPSGGDPSSDPTVSQKEEPDPIRLVGIIALCIPAVAIIIIIFARPRTRKKTERPDKYSS